MANQWHAVDKALPIDDRPVLVTYRKQARPHHRTSLRSIVTLAVFGDDLCWHFISGRLRSALPRNVSHWMPLPEPAPADEQPVGKRGQAERAPRSPSPLLGRAG